MVFPSPVNSDLRPNDPSQFVCPSCGRHRVRWLAPSDRGAYCRCESCGHMWQQEGARVSMRSTPAIQLHRRKSDAKPPRSQHGKDPYAADVVCPHCGKEDEEQQRLVRRLKQRIADLERDNAILLESARSFGDLADRLNEQLRERQRVGSHRRRGGDPDNS